MKTKYMTLKVWGMLAIFICIASTSLIATASWLTDHGNDLPPWF